MSPVEDGDKLRVVLNAKSSIYQSHGIQEENKNSLP